MEEKLIFPYFTRQMAFNIGTRIAKEVLDNHLRVTVDIYLGSQQLYHFAGENTTYDQDEWIRRKRNVVMRFCMSSYEMALKLEKQNMTLYQKYTLDPKDYVAAGGSVPIIIRDVGVVGAITCAGLSSLEDHQLVCEAMKKELEELS